MGHFLNHYIQNSNGAADFEYMFICWFLLLCLDNIRMKSSGLAKSRGLYILEEHWARITKVNIENS